MQKVTYGIHQTELGEMVIGVTDLGLCWLGFMTTKAQGAYKGDGLSRLKEHFKKVEIIHGDVATKPWIEKIMKAWRQGNIGELTLDLQGTEFEQSVWHSLLYIPYGEVVSYGDVANDIGNPKAARAVGTAVGNNPISLIVPCHRVVQKNGSLGNYGWGLALKEKILKAEGAL